MDNRFLLLGKFRKHNMLKRILSLALGLCAVVLLSCGGGGGSSSGVGKNSAGICAEVVVAESEIPGRNKTFRNVCNFRINTLAVWIDTRQGGRGVLGEEVHFSLAPHEKRTIETAWFPPLRTMSHPSCAAPEKPVSQWDQPGNEFACR